MDTRKLNLYGNALARGLITGEDIPEPYYTELMGEAKPEDKQEDTQEDVQKDANENDEQ